MKKRKNNKKKKKQNNKFCTYLIAFLLVLSFFELNSDIRLGNTIRDLIFSPSNNLKTQSFINSYENELKKENKELKDLMNIKLSLTDFEIEYATVIERNNSYWLNEITINKGIINGITKNSPVITKSGLIGRVSSLSLTTSKVKLITEEKSSVSVTVNKKNKLLTTYNDKVIIRGINDKDKIKVGDIVTTNGLSNNFPKGILIGKISKIFKEDNKVGYIAEVEISNEINDLRFVAVLKRKMS